MSSPRKCEQCGSVFVANSHNHTFCSHNCEAKSWAIAHRDKMRESCRRWGAANREVRREYRKRYEQEHRAERLEYKQIYHQEHRVEEIEYKRQRREKNLSKVRGISTRSESKRRAAKLGNGGSFTEEEFTGLCKQYDWQCAYCGCTLTPETVTVDHKIPVSRGGSSNIENIAPACGRCNSSKRAATAEEYMIRLGKKEGQLCLG